MAPKKIINLNSAAEMIDQEYTITKIVILCRIYSAAERSQKYSILDTDESVFASVRKNALLHEVLFRMITPGVEIHLVNDNLLEIIAAELSRLRSELKHPELIKLTDAKIKSLGL